MNEMIICLYMYIYTNIKNFSILSLYIIISSNIQLIIFVFIILNNLFEFYKVYINIYLNSYIPYILYM